MAANFLHPEEAADNGLAGDYGASSYEQDEGGSVEVVPITYVAASG